MNDPNSRMNSAYDSIRTTNNYIIKLWMSLLRNVLIIKVLVILYKTFDYCISLVTQRFKDQFVRTWNGLLSIQNKWQYYCMFLDTQTRGEKTEL